MLFTKILALFLTSAVVFATPLPGDSGTALQIRDEDGSSEAKAVTNAAGGLQDDELNALRQFASANGLNPNDHIDTTGGFLTTSEQLAALIASAPTEEDNNGGNQERTLLLLLGIKKALLKKTFVWTLNCGPSTGSCASSGCGCNVSGNLYGCSGGGYNWGGSSCYPHKRFFFGLIKGWKSGWGGNGGGGSCSCICNKY